MKGPIKLRFRGLMAEKLIDRARAEGILIEMAERVSPRETLLYAGEADAQRLLKLAQAHHLDVQILQTRGLPRLKHNLKRRIAMALSMVIFLSALTLISERAWLIEVRLTGAQPYNLERAMQKLGIKVGMSAGDVDAYALARELQQEAGDLAYVGVRRQGVRLLIEAVGEDQPPDLYDPDAARDLRAVCDGVVESVTVLAGVAAVKPGDTVRRGQTLIRGEERIGDELTRGVCALGSVIARVWATGEAEGFLEKTQHEPTGNQRINSALVGPGFRLALLQAEPFALEEVKTDFLPLGGLFFPLGVERARHIELKKTTVALDLASVQREVSEKALREARQKRPDSADEIDKWVDYSMIEEGKIRARASIELRMNIAGSADSALSEDE
jgi:similar to stage IV sporulation protein